MKFSTLLLSKQLFGKQLSRKSLSRKFLSREVVKKTCGKVLVVTAFMMPITVNASTLAEKLIDMSEDVSHQVAEPSANTIELTLSELVDSSGLRYVGGVVDEKSIARYLHQLRNILGDDFHAFRDNQKQRDHGKFHITLVNPFEMKALTSEQQKTLLTSHNHFISFELTGLGKVSKDKASAYFVVAKSRAGQALRAKYGLSEKDFHVTLGFSPNDVHGLRKNSTTLIQ